MGKVKLQKLDKYRIEKTSFPMTGYHGDLVIIHLRRMDFPWNKPSMNWGSPVYENHHMYIKLYIYNLVGGLAHFLFSISYIGNFIIPTDELIFFKWLISPLIIFHWNCTLKVVIEKQVEAGPLGIYGWSSFPTWADFLRYPPFWADPYQLKMEECTGCTQKKW